MPTPRWIIGRGLLGSAIARMRDGSAYSVAMPWDDPDVSKQALRDGLDRLLSATEGPVEIYWCAGKGVTSTPRDLLDVEVDVFTSLLDALAAAAAADRQRVTVFLASSVGGAYAGSRNPPFTESTPAAPASEYGRAKLRMEDALRTQAATSGSRGFIGRITNLYGPGQDLGKGQGLISVVVGSYITARPVPIYVSLDTLRDYIYEDDCARVVDAAMQRVSHEPAGTVVTKIIGAMTAISIGAILGENTRLRRRRAPVILGGGDPRGQSLDLRVRSEVWTDLDGLVRTTFSEGLDAVYRAQLSRWSQASRSEAFS